MRLSPLLASLVLSLCAIAHADTFQTFDLTSTFSDGGSIKGTVVLNTTTNAFSSSTLAGSGFSTAAFNTTFYGLGTAGQNAGYVVNFVSPSGPNLGFVLDLPVSNLSGYAGGNICTSANCSNASLVFTSLNYPTLIRTSATSGSLVLETATTPEPSSILLLATGLITIVSPLRSTLRRRVSA